MDESSYPGPKKQKARANVPGFGQTRFNNPQTDSSSSNCPLALSIASLATRSLSAPSTAFQGRHANASPPTSNNPSPLVSLTPLLRWNPESRHASMAVVGAGMLPSTFNASKLVWVSSLDSGPRSWLTGLCACERGIMRVGRMGEL